MPKTKSIASPETRTELFSVGHWDWKLQQYLTPVLGEKWELKLQWFPRENSIWSKQKADCPEIADPGCPAAPSWGGVQTFFMEILCFTIPWVWLGSTFLCGSLRKDWSLRFTHGVSTISQVHFNAQLSHFLGWAVIPSRMPCTQVVCTFNWLCYLSLPFPTHCIPLEASVQMVRAYVILRT